MILITGASGTVGREVAARLADRALLRLAARGAGDLPVGSEAVPLDFRDPATFPAALRGVDRVFLMRPPALARPRRDFGPFVAAMVAAGVGRVAFLSVRGAGSNPLLPHRGIERLLEASKLAWTHLRPNDFMQNFATVHRDDIRDRGGIWAPAGRGRTSYVDARDVAAVAALALLEPGHERRAYTLTGPVALDLFDVARALSAALGRHVTYRDPSALAFLRHNAAAGRSLALGLVMVGVYGVARLGFAARVEPDLPALLGRPATPFAAFADDYRAVWDPADAS